MTQQDGVPLFAWDAIPGAKEYGVLVYAAGARRPVWMWTGAATQIRFGALPETLPTIPTPTGRPLRTPTPVAGLEWQVIASGADGRAVAMSPRQKLP